jgi:hypothetical protein
MISLVKGKMEVSHHFLKIAPKSVILIAASTEIFLI